MMRLATYFSALRPVHNTLHSYGGYRPQLRTFEMNDVVINTPR